MTIQGYGLMDEISCEELSPDDNPIFIDDCPVCRGKRTILEPDEHGFVVKADCPHCQGEGIVIRRAS